MLSIITGDSLCWENKTKTKQTKPNIDVRMKKELRKSIWLKGVSRTELPWCCAPIILSLKLKKYWTFGFFTWWKNWSLEGFSDFLLPLSSTGRLCGCKGPASLLTPEMLIPGCVVLCHWCSGAAVFLSPVFFSLTFSQQAQFPASLSPSTSPPAPGIQQICHRCNVS